MAGFQIAEVRRLLRRDRSGPGRRTRSRRACRRWPRRRRGSGAAGCHRRAAASISRKSRPPARGVGVLRARPESPRALAKAEIIRPFHAVRILSSRCGRGRVARAANSVRVQRRLSALHSALRLEVPRRLFDSVRLEENIPAGELAVRIVRDVAVRLPRRSGMRTSAPVPHRAGRPPRCNAPDVERAFALFLADRRHPSALSASSAE